MPTVFHVSDLHFGRPSVPEQIEAIEAMIQAHRFDVVAISGDLSQRALPEEMRRARAFIEFAGQASRVIVVPGNHDVTWWRSPLGIFGHRLLYRTYRTHISSTLEPVLRVPGATFVGLNTAQGITLRTLTWNPRDLGILGDLHRKQLEWARRQFEESPADDYRVIVMHHNLMRGELSRRHGLKNTASVLKALGDMGVDLILCGHDHQEAIHYVEHTTKGSVISTAGTISSRSRGRRPSSANVVALHPGEIEVRTAVWIPDTRTFVPGAPQLFRR